ncbi:MAG TPA: superoxide dismutase family protein, partial [Polyangia bacterium]
MRSSFPRSGLLALLLAGSLVACSSDNGGGGGGTGGSTSSSGGSSGRGGAGGSSSSGSGGSVSGSGGSASGSGGSASSSGGSTGSGGSTAGSGGSSGGDAGTGDTGGGNDAREVGGGDTAAPVSAIARIMPSGGGTITGTVTFVAKGADVEVQYALENCPPGVHPTHIHEGTSCASVQSQGMHWGGTRGDGIGSGSGQITCDAQMKGSFTTPYVRVGNNPATRWTIGTGGNTDILGHVLIVHGVNDTNQRHGCGIIE